MRWQALGPRHDPAGLSTAVPQSEGSSLLSRQPLHVPPVGPLVSTAAFPPRPSEATAVFLPEAVFPDPGQRSLHSSHGSSSLGLGIAAWGLIFPSAALPSLQLRRRHCPRTPA